MPTAVATEYRKSDAKIHGMDADPPLTNSENFHAP